MLSHLETCNFVVFAFWNWNIAVIHAKNVGLLLSNTSFSETIVTPGSLVATKSDTSCLSTVVDTGEFGKGSPSATNIEKLLTWLEVDFLADDGKFVVLELFESLLLVGIRNNTRSIDHTWAEEPSVEVITSVIMIADLLLICKVSISEALNSRADIYTLRTGVHDDFRRKLEEYELEQAQGKPEACPIVSVLEYLQCIAIEVNLSIEIHVVESLHGDLVASAILGLICGILEGKVVLDRAARERDFFSLPRTEGRSQVPETDQDRYSSDEPKEDSSLESSANLPC